MLVLSRYFAVLLLSACSLESANIVTVGGVANIVWQEHELRNDIAVRNLARSDNLSTHVIRLRGSEPPHYHDRHDLSVTLLRGESTIHFRNKSFKLRPGSVVFIPKGEYHWAENTGKGPSLVYSVMSPPFDGTDRRVEQASQ